MNKIYEMVEGDDIRTFKVKLYSNLVPTEAILVLTLGAVRKEYELVLVGEIWQHRFTQTEVDELVAGNWRGQVYASFEDGTNGTYPTRGYITFRSYLKL